MPETMMCYSLNSTSNSKLSERILAQFWPIELNLLNVSDLTLTTIRLDLISSAPSSPFALTTLDLFNSKTLELCHFKSEITNNKTLQIVFCSLEGWILIMYMVDWFDPWSNSLIPHINNRYSSLVTFLCSVTVPGFNSLKKFITVVYYSYTIPLLK